MYKMFILQNLDFSCKRMKQTEKENKSEKDPATAVLSTGAWIHIIHYGFKSPPIRYNINNNIE